MDNVRIVLDEIEVNFDNDDINIVKDVCFLVTDRAAKLVSISKEMHDRPEMKKEP